MIDLTTKYLGLTLRTPIVASAGPLTREVDLIRRLVDSGASAIVLPSLFEEEILLEERQLDAAVVAGTNHFAEALDYFPHRLFADYENPLDRYLGHLAAVRGAVDVPVIASINATSAGRVDELRPAARRRRCRCPRAEPVPRRSRPCPVRS